jgi:hypothetical protein
VAKGLPRFSYFFFSFSFLLLMEKRVIGERIVSSVGAGDIMARLAQSQMSNAHLGGLFLFTERVTGPIGCRGGRVGICDTDRAWAASHGGNCLIAPDLQMMAAEEKAPLLGGRHVQSSELDPPPPYEESPVPRAKEDSMFNIVLVSIAFFILFTSVCLSKRQ